ncbi:hypothetical protein WJX73_002631 [Symbiochloris irregularis]|uniref:Mitochondrial import inner membrane translocase subunit TIM22 n=1 Tax=Symbiochloris irregularis TaxID=706552 RepID=A0AAW1PV72_9CHLO
MSDQTQYDPHGRGFSDLTQHCLEKGFQAGSVVGTVALVPYAAFRHFRTAPGQSAAVGTVVQKTYRVLAKSSLWGIAAGAVLEAGMIFAKGIDTEGMEDRAYKLHYNNSQNRTDLFARDGALVGAIVGSAAGLNWKNALGGAALGTAAGVFAHVASYDYKDEGPTPNAMLAEVKHAAQK